MVHSTSILQPTYLTLFDFDNFLVSIEKGLPGEIKKKKKIEKLKNRIFES